MVALSKEEMGSLENSKYFAVPICLHWQVLRREEEQCLSQVWSRYKVTAERK